MHRPIFALALLLSAPPASAGVLCRTPDYLPRRDEATAGARPDSVGYVDSARFPIRVHYRRDADLTRARDVVLPAAEDSWQAEVVEMGWPSPPADSGVGGDDRYDIYLTNQGTFGGAYTFGAGPDVTPDDQWYSVPSYIALDDRAIPDGDMFVYVAHEFNHAVQYTIDAWELVLFPWEATAEAIADLVDDASDSYYYEIVDFNELPFASLLFDGYHDEVIAYDDYSYYEYGGMAFTLFLEERHGAKDGTTLVRMWENLAQSSRAQEPDFLDALAQVDQSAPSAAALYTEFAVWRMFVAGDDDGAHFEEAAAWGEEARVAVEAEFSLEHLPDTPLQPVDPPYELGTSYWRFDLGAGTTDRLHAEVAGDSGYGWGLAWAVWPREGGPAVTGWVPPGADPLAEIPLAGGVRLMIGVVNGGRATLEAETDPVERASFTLSLTREAAPDTGGGTDTADVHDTDTAAKPEDSPTPGDGTPEASGCGCGGGTALPGPWLVLAAIFCRRARRDAVRRTDDTALSPRD